MHNNIISFGTFLGTLKTSWKLILGMSSEMSLFLSLFLNSCCNPLNNYMVFNDTDGLYTYTFEAEKKVCKNLKKGFFYYSSFCFLT